MRTDLGTWRGAQARTVVRVLERAGLDPQTEDTVAGTRITVPEAQNDAAHLTLAGAMDDIARAAHEERTRSERPTRTRTDRPGRTAPDPDRPLVSERLRSLAPLTGLVVALVLAAMIPPGAIRTSVFVLALVGFGVVWARRHGDGATDDDYRRPPR